MSAEPISTLPWGDGNCVRLSHDGLADEVIVQNATVHMERMNHDQWSISMTRPDGNRLSVELFTSDGSSIGAMAEDDAETLLVQAVEPPSARRCACAGLFDEVFCELSRASTKFPTWPTDPLHALAVLQEEVGELQKTCLQLCYEPHKVKAGDLKTEAIQTAAMALRFLVSLDRYEFRPGTQHQQDTP